MAENEIFTYDICFIVLHFIDADMTSRCVDTLLNAFTNESIYIVVVDNGSNNNSGELLTNRYSRLNNVKILISKNNLGFSQGNNLGYDWAKENIVFEFLAVINNDVLVTHNNFLETTRECYRNTGFAVMGPDIISQASKLHQNPLFEKGFSLSEMESFYRYMTFRRNFFALYYLKKSFERFISRFNDSFYEKQKCDYKNPLVNPVLFGACYIFSEKFFKHKEYLFNPNTFMYFEENILHYECMKEGLKMVYCPSITVDHYEDVSTKAYIKSNYQRLKWAQIENVKSEKYLLDVMRSDTERK